jgi:hypothetical protein
VYGATAAAACTTADTHAAASRAVLWLGRCWCWKGVLHVVAWWHGSTYEVGHDHHKHHKQGRHHAGLLLLGRRQLRQGFQACKPGEVDCRGCGRGDAREGARLWLGKGKARLAKGWWLGRGKGRGTRPKGTAVSNRVRLTGSISAFGPDWQDRNQPSPTGRFEINPVR